MPKFDKDNIEITRLDLQWFRGPFIDYRDDGYVREGAKTRKYSLFSRAGRSLLGYVQWWPAWRKYVFFPLNSVFDNRCLREIAKFCEDTTTTHVERRNDLPKLAKRAKIVAARERNLERIALTKADERDRMLIESGETVCL